MSAMRALKRRRLDNASNQDDSHNSSSSISTARSPAIEKRNIRASQSSPAANGSDIAKPSAPTARNLWQEAKAKALADKQQSRKSRSRREVDIYDDIEGANSGQRSIAGRLPQRKGESGGIKRKSLDPLRNQKEQEIISPKEPSSDASKAKSDADVVSPLKKTLDPLRNQKAQESATSSPRKSGTSLGFFKQFHGPKIETSSPVLAANTKPGLVTGTKKAGEAEPQGRAKNWFYGKPKKTFEDEIRELEESARKKAADDESEDELASQDVTRRSSARQPSQKSSVEQTKHDEEPAPSPSTRTPKPPDRRKAQQVKPLVLKDLLQAEEESPNENLEVPDSEEDKPTQTVKKPPLVRSHRPSASKNVTPRVSKLSGPKFSKPFEAEHLQCIQRIVLEKLVRKRTVPLTNVDDEHAKVHAVISQAIVAGESNSMLLIGARGSGKSTLIDQILREESIKHPDDFHAVRLNGFVHTDDKIALREIWRQLGKEMELEEEDSTSKNYADTMSKLLALLSHPAEQEIEEPGQITKSVIFILDEFELFASHPRQTLLYNLFDIAQSRKAPIAVLGLTTRIDVAESLEKRVKSRFSHRYVHLSLPKSFQAFKQICSAALSITSKELTLDEKATLSGSAASKDSMSDEPLALLQWNTLAEEILMSKLCHEFLQRLYFTTKSVPDFLTSLATAVATMPIDSTTTTAAILVDHFTSALSQPLLQPPDSKLSLLYSLSTIQLALLVCAARLTNIYGTEVITFALAYEEYRNLAAKAKLQASAAGAIAQGAGNRVWGKAVAKGAWEELVECGLVMEDGRAGGTARVDVGLEELGMSGVELGQWARWCKEI